MNRYIYIYLYYIIYIIRLTGLIRLRFVSGHLTDAHIICICCRLLGCFCLWQIERLRKVEQVYLCVDTGRAATPVRSSFFTIHVQPVDRNWPTHVLNRLFKHASFCSSNKIGLFKNNMPMTYIIWLGLMIGITQQNIIKLRQRRGVL